MNRVCLLTVVFALSLAGCGVGEAEVDEAITSDSADSAGAEQALSGCLFTGMRNGAWVHAMSANAAVRSGPSPAYPSKGQAPRGSWVTVHEPRCGNNGFYYVNVAGLTGWVNGAYMYNQLD